jgi:hypothetical protein
MNIIRCAVFSNNSNGEPDIFFCKINCSQEQYNKVEHYKSAMQLAQENGYEAFLACDQNDPAGACLKLFNWKSIPDPQLTSKNLYNKN